MLAALAAAFAVAMPHAALAAPGDRDATFHGDGFASLDAGAFESIYDVAIHEGKVVVVGSTSPSKGAIDFVVARFEGDGDPDASFGGGDGFVTTDFGGGQDVSSGLAVLPNGRILVAGWSQQGDIYRVAIAKYRANGNLDQTFGGGDGKVTKSFGFEEGAVAYDLLLLPSGKMLVGGGAYRVVNGSDLAVWRFNANGTLDTTFGGGDGMARRAVGPGYDEAWRLLRMPGGDIVAGGWSELPGDAGYDVLLVRFQSDGRIDPTFGGGAGEVVLDPTDAETEYAAGLGRSGGKIVIVDQGEDATGEGEVVLLRLKGNGTPDPTFGGGDGEVVRDLGGHEEPNDLVIQDDGKIVVAGERNEDELFVARFGAGGAPDMSFGSGGYNTAAEPGEGRSVTLQPNGRIMIAGDNDDGIVVTRFLP